MGASRFVHRRQLGPQLRQFAALRSCSSAELETLQRHSVVGSFRAGDIVCLEGTVGRQAFLVLEGDAMVDVGGVEVGRVGSGEFVGEMALLSRKFRTATVTACTPLTVLVFSVPEFETVLRSVPTLARRMSVVLSERLRVRQLRSVPV